MTTPHDANMNLAADKLWLALAAGVAGLSDAERAQVEANGGVKWLPDPDDGDLCAFQVNGRTFLLARRSKLIDPAVSVDEFLASLVFVDPLPDTPGDLEP